jgi:alkaline phosphatase D
VTTPHPDARNVDAPFHHGVASFDPTATSVLLWTRAPGVTQVRWTVAPSHDAAPVARGEVDVPVDHDGCVTVEVDGLDPATSYLYWFEAGSTRSPVARTRTLPAAGTAPVRIASVSCGDYSMGHFTAYRAVAEADVDLVLHVGDYIYETRKGDVRPMAPDRDIVSLDDYRTRYAQTRSDPDLIALHQRHPMVTIWDDHDIADNAWRHGAKNHDPNAHGPWDARLRAAAVAHHEWLPARLRDPDDPLTVYRSFTIGDLAELVVLDTRIIGRDQHADDDPSLPFGDERRSLLGDEQRAWAHERVRDTARPWCVLVSQVVLNHMELPVETGAQLGELAPSGYAVIEGKAMCTDEWDGYPAERDALVKSIAERGAGVVTVSGDVHSAWAFEGPCNAGEPVAVEFVTPCVTATPMGRQLPAGWRKLLDVLAERLPEARWFDLERHGYAVLEIAEDTVTARWYAVDVDDPAARAEPTGAWRHHLARPGRLEPLDELSEDRAGADDRGDDRHDDRGDDRYDGPDGHADGSILPHREGGESTRPHVTTPGRPADLVEAAEQRRVRRRRRRIAAVTTVAAGAAALAVTRPGHGLRRDWRPVRHRLGCDLVTAVAGGVTGLRWLQARVKRGPSAQAHNWSIDRRRPAGGPP